MSGAELIAAERQRQIDVESYAPDRDDRYTHGELVNAAAAYMHARNATSARRGLGMAELCGWPWSVRSFRIDDDPVRNLVKAGALIAAEIDRLQRLAPPAPSSSLR